MKTKWTSVTRLKVIFRSGLSKLGPRRTKKTCERGDPLGLYMLNEFGCWLSGLWVSVNPKLQMAGL